MKEKEETEMNCKEVRIETACLCVFLHNDKITVVYASKCSCNCQETGKSEKSQVAIITVFSTVY